MPVSTPAQGGQHPFCVASISKRGGLNLEANIAGIHGIFMADTIIYLQISIAIPSHVLLNWILQTHEPVNTFETFSQNQPNLWYRYPIYNFN